MTKPKTLSDEQVNEISREILNQRNPLTDIPELAQPEPGYHLYADGYDDLAAVLAAGFEQAAFGKGKERHANDKPFNRQPLFEISRMAGVGFPIGQAMKKLQEAKSMSANGATSAAIRELHGTIVYAAAAIILIEEGTK